MKTTITTVNLYRSNGQWCYAAWSGEEYDHSDALDVSRRATDNDATAAVAALFPDAAIHRVSDVEGR